MKRVLCFLSILILAVSCKAIMEPLRVQLEGTYWLYETDSQTARVCFNDETHVNVLQHDIASGYIQSLDGTYFCDGHAVFCNGDDWPNVIKFVRTFTHLKNNSTNKNLTPLYPESYSIKGSVWAILLKENLRFTYFGEDGTCIEGTFKNVAHEDGIPYGWEWKKASYTQNGSSVEAGPFKSTLYNEFMLVDTLAVMISTHAPKSTGTSALTGSIWTYKTSGAPGVIIFTSDKDFTRILVGSRIVHETKVGTYELQGTSLTMTLDEKTETCQLEGGRFTFFERTYEKVTLP